MPPGRGFPAFPAGFTSLFGCELMRGTFFMRGLAAFAGYLALLVFIHGSKTATAARARLLTARVLLLSIVILISIRNHADLLIKGFNISKGSFPTGRRKLGADVIR
jgi:hypothetical protein